VAEKLLSQGITRLDGLIITHYDADHAGGAVLLLSRIPADTLYLPDIEDDGDARAKLVEKHELKIQWITETVSFSGNWGEMTLIAENSGEEENESGLCILFQSQNCDILITGDRSKAGERALIRQIDLPKVELLVVGHHGSPSSTSFELLSVVQPGCAVISVGKDNHYGHPSKDVLDLLSMFGCEVRRTDLEGTIVFKG
jgi:competence protein ComEC